MTLTLIGHTILLVALVIAVIRNRQLAKALNRACGTMELQNGLIAELRAFKSECEDSIFADATIEIRCCGPSYFAVCRKMLDTTIDIKRIYYNPDDPDDIIYKHNCAEEVADKLNERP